MQILLCGAGVGACGLERDYEAFLKAADGPTESTQSSGSTASVEGSTSTAGTGSTGTGGADSTTSDDGTEGAEASSGGSTAGMGESTGTGSTTGGVTPFCGDGVVNQAFEECDDGNFEETDRCAISCQRIRLVFVTSSRMQGKMSGLQGADAYCKSLALAAKQADFDSPIEDPGNFKALLSTSKETIFERHFIGKGPYKLVNGLRVSDSFAALFTAPLQNPINVDERSQTQHATVWTGTNIDGSPFPGIDFCADWTSVEGSNTYGDGDATDSEWLYQANEYNPESDCYSERPVYCVEQ